MGRGRILLLGFVALAALGPLSLVAPSVLAQLNNIPPPNANCQPDGQAHLVGQMYPTSIEPEFPVWCYTQPPALPATGALGANQWVDTFDNDGPSITQFNDHAMGYRVFDNFVAASSNFKAGYFVNVNHWMIDLVDVSSDRLSGGVLVSPDRQFAFENGKVVVEVDAAAGSDGMLGADRFYEIDLTPAPAPTGITVDTLYGYGAFGGVGAVGCRLERNTQGGNFVCAMYDNSGRATDGRSVDGQPCPPDAITPTGSFDCRSGRVWETQGVGTARTAASVTGGYPGYPIPGTNLHLSDVWRQCATNELDLHCRDRFRMEVTKDSIHLFVNGYPAMQIDGLYAVNPDTGVDNRIPDFWFQQGVRPYFTSWVNGGQHTPVRWHWDRVAVNPHDASGNFAAPSAAPSFCLGQPHNTCPDSGLPPDNTVGPTSVPATATPVPASPTRTPLAATATSTSTSMPSRTPTTAPSVTSTPQSTATSAATLPAGTQRVTFDDLSAINRPLGGQYPSGLIDWGSNQWYLSGPWRAFTTNSVGFNGAGPTSAPFSFLSPRRLVSVDAYNGGTTATTVTLNCAGQPPVSQTVAAGQMTTIPTGWTQTCSPVAIGSSNGWATNFDNLVIGIALPTATPTATPVPKTVTFDDLSGQNQVLNGQYPVGVIDWGTNAWYHSGPFGLFTTKSVGFNGAGPTSASFTFLTPRRLVSVQAYNGGNVSMTVSLACDGQTTTQTVAARQQMTITTGWLSPCTTVTVGSTNGWDTNFDNLVYS